MIEQATAGALHGAMFCRVVQVANDVFHAGITLQPVRDPRQWQRQARPWRGQIRTITASEVAPWR